MKKCILITFAILSLTACVKEKAHVVETVVNPVKKNDSTKIDSLQKIAWGDAKFGISVEEAKKTNIFKNYEEYSKKTDIFRDLHAPFDEMIDGISSVEVSFFNNRLFRVDMESMEREANYYDTKLKNLVDYLYSLISEKYGEPISGDGFPDFSEMQTGVSVSAYLWEIGDKRIYVDVEEVYSGSRYKVTCSIISGKESDPVSEYNRKIDEEESSKQVNGF